MFMSETLQEKWRPVLSHPDLPEISDPYKKGRNFCGSREPRKDFLMKKMESKVFQSPSPVNHLLVQMVLELQTGILF